MEKKNLVMATLGTDTNRKISKKNKVYSSIKTL